MAIVASFLMATGSATAFVGLVWAQHKIDKRGICFRNDCAASPVPSPSSGPVGYQLGGECKQTCNYLVLGSDSRSNLTPAQQRGFQTNSQIGGYRSDTIILVHIDGATRHATIVSIPRDLVVNIPGYGQNKINAAFNFGAMHGGVPAGALLSAKTVSQLTGLDINHMVVVDLAGFESLVQAVGGVPFCTPIPLKDDPQAYPGAIPGDLGSGLTLSAGCSTLDGPTALALVRARSVVSNGQLVDCVSDFARIQRQQQFMRALLNKILSPTMLLKLPQLVDVATKQLTFDKGLKVTDLLALANAMKGLASGNADFRTLPTQLGWATIGGLRSSVLTLTPQGQQFLSRLRNGQSLGDLGTQVVGQAPSPANIAVRVYDSNSQGHAQNDVWNAQLNASGFKMMDTAAEPVPTALASLPTVILYNKGYEEQAKVVANYVPGYKIQQAKPGQLPSDTQVGVVVTAKYVHRNPGSGNNPSLAVSCPYHS